MSVTAGALKAAALDRHLRSCGYEGELLRAGYRFGSTSGETRSVPLVGFAHLPADARSACVAAIDVGDEDTMQAVAQYRELGAPLVFVCRRGHLELWKQGASSPERHETVKALAVDSYFGRNADRFGPQSIYRAKAHGLFESSYQLSFVDAGLVPVLESELGERLRRLVESAFKDATSLLGGPMTQERGEWLLQEVFWLLAAKILHDKEVPRFKSLDIRDIDEVRQRVARHYGTSQETPDLDPARRAALLHAATTIERFSHLGQVTTESLAYVYESALVSDETRDRLGTHSTPSYLVDYILARLAPWIRDIPLHSRYVLEPACGHAAFLVAAMRLLREELPATMAVSDSRLYLRERLHGIEKDPLAREIARLSLTLADIPNSNGWRLDAGDMYDGQGLERLASRTTILLTNPPYEAFTPEERKEYETRGTKLGHHNKAVELFRRSLPQLKPGAVIGLIVPQSFLSSHKLARMREEWLRQFEFLEVCLLPDKVFEHADQEVAVLLGRKTEASRASRASIAYKRVREQDVERFKRSYIVTSEQDVEQARFINAPGSSMLISELDAIWQHCPNGVLEDHANVQQGFSFVGKNKLPPEKITFSQEPFPGSVPGFLKVPKKNKGKNKQVDLVLHRLLKPVHMNLAEEVIARMRGGKPGYPQVLLPYGPSTINRGPWRLKALIDQEGHAISSRFIGVRPKTENVPLEFFWALLNSPYANAFVYEHGDKRSILVGMLRQMPFPRVTPTDIERVSQAVTEYLQAARRLDDERNHANEVAARDRLLRMDAEVLRLYDLPPRKEKMLLDLFSGHTRPGLAFEFEGYFRAEFRSAIPLHEYLSEHYQRATAKNFLARRSEKPPRELLEALSNAVSSFQE